MLNFFVVVAPYLFQHWWEMMMMVTFAAEAAVTETNQCQWEMTGKTSSSNMHNSLCECAVRFLHMYVLYQSTTYCRHHVLYWSLIRPHDASRRPYVLQPFYLLKTGHLISQAAERTQPKYITAR